MLTHFRRKKILCFLCRSQYERAFNYQLMMLFVGFYEKGEEKHYYQFHNVLVILGIITA